MLGLGREYRLFNGKQIIGLLKNDFWNRKAYGEFKGYLVRFESMGFGKKQARILDIAGEKVLGTLSFNFAPRSATIECEGESFEWMLSKDERRGSWLVGNAEEEAKYLAEDATGSKGTIADAYLPPMVLLAGLYVHGYFLKRKVLGFVVGFLLGVLIVYLVS